MTLVSKRVYSSDWAEDVFSFTVCNGHPRPEPEPAGILPLCLLQDWMQLVGLESLIYSVFYLRVESVEFSLYKLPLVTAFFLCRSLTVLHVRCLWWKCLLYTTLTTKGVQMIVLVYSFIVIVFFSNRRLGINEPYQGLVHSLCHSIGSGVYPLLHLLWPCRCSRMGPVPIATRSVLQRFIIAYVIWVCGLMCIFAVKRDPSIV